MSNKTLSRPTLAFVSSIFFTTSAVAQTPQMCIEDPQKNTPCERLIVKKTAPAVMQQSTLIEPVVCICISDFPSFLGEREVSANKLTDAEVKVLQEWQLSARAMHQLLRY